ncbi:MAG: GMC family oxidoreductase N-terminal domain-containing protein [Kofleriaceae bacterium]|nr:GMC family oxidoreductase N-terminal domain-containing protein [Kofleriaceae bacterium]
MVAKLPRPAVAQGAVPDRVFTRDTLRGDTVLDADVVIVGSGAGGATLAAELAEAGLDVVMIEEGRYWTTRDFTAQASAMTRQLYRDGGASMAIGDPPVMFQEGRAVGGSTVINGGMSWRTPERILERWRREAGLEHIEAPDMEAHFARVERRIHVRHQDPETVGRDNELLKHAAPTPRAGRSSPTCAARSTAPGSNNCAFGCPTGAASVGAGQRRVPRALHFGARLLSDVKVERILLHGKRAIGVAGRVVGEGERPGPRVTVRAKLVVAACGAIQTPALLARSGVRSPSGRLGHNLAAPPQRQAGRHLRRAGAGLGGRAPGLPGARVRGRGPAVRGGQHPARRHRDDLPTSAAPRSAR